MTIESTGSLTIKESSTSFANEFAGLDLLGTINTAGSGLKLSGTNVVEGGITGGAPATTVKLTSGTLGGKGTIAPSFVVEGGAVQPGGAGAIGTLKLGAGYVQEAGAHLDLDLESGSQFDRIQPAAASNSFVEGVVAAHLIGSYLPTVGTTWEFISGTFGVINGATVSPAQFAIHAVSGGDELELESPLPSGGGGGGGSGEGGGSGSTGTGTDSTGGSGQVGGSTLPTPTPTSVECVVPKLKGLTPAKAKSALKSAHCTPGKVTRRFSPKVKKGRVIAGGKKVGKELPAGTKVGLAVSKGAKP